MKEVVVNGKTFRLPKRYQDRRIVEKLIQKEEWKVRGVEANKPIVPRKQELEIPIEVDHKTTYYVRESKIFSPKWIKYFSSKEQLNEYIENYKNTINYDTESSRVGSSK